MSGYRIPSIEELESLAKKWKAESNEELGSDPEFARHEDAVVAGVLDTCAKELRALFLPENGANKGCGFKLAAGQHWAFCGETDMGQTAPALCTVCGGEFLRA